VKELISALLQNFYNERQVSTLKNQGINSDSEKPRKSQRTRRRQKGFFSVSSVIYTVRKSGFGVAAIPLKHCLSGMSGETLQVTRRILFDNR